MLPHVDHETDGADKVSTENGRFNVMNTQRKVSRNPRSRVKEQTNEIQESKLSTGVSQKEAILF